MLSFLSCPPRLTEVGVAPWMHRRKVSQFCVRSVKIELPLSPSFISAEQGRKQGVGGSRNLGMAPSQMGQVEIEREPSKRCVVRCYPRNRPPSFSSRPALLFFPERTYIYARCEFVPSSARACALPAQHHASTSSAPAIDCFVVCLSFICRRTFRRRV